VDYSGCCLSGRGLNNTSARYHTRDDAKRKFPSLDLEVLKISLIGKVREHILDVFDQAELESVQICILLGSFYTYNAQPNLAFVIHGAGIKAAQAMGLHKEPLYRPGSPVETEIRKRVWWALYVFDRFVRYCLLSNKQLLIICNKQLRVHCVETTPFNQRPRLSSLHA
jgi:hypothetical protein